MTGEKSKPPTEPPRCVICSTNPSTTRIAEGNPAYHGKPICDDCQAQRKLLLDTR